MNKTSALQTDTHTHQYLLPSSCHAPHTCKNVPYSQAIHLRRIFWSSDTLFQRCSTELANHLKNRKYIKDTIVSAQISKLPQSPANRLLNIRRINSAGSLLSRLHHPHLPNLSNIVRKHLPILHLSPKLQHAIPDPPVLAYRRPKNLRDNSCFCSPQTTCLQ